MILSSNHPEADNRKDLFKTLTAQWIALLEGEVNRTSNLANLAAAIYGAFEWHWVGFYEVDERRDELVLGPFQGPVACTRLRHGKGVCAAAWDTMEAQVVDDVHAFPGHIACSALSVSELVLPIIVDGHVVAVLDIDSAKAADFSTADVKGFDRIVNYVASRWNHWE